MAAAAAAVAALYVVAGTGWVDPLRLARGHFRLRTGPDPGLDAASRAKHPTASFAAWRAAFVIDPAAHEPFLFAEDAHATVVAFADPGGRWLVVNGKPDASTQHDVDTQMLLAHAPLFLAPQAKSLLVIGHGSGMTAGSALRHPLERADIVEISPAVLAADALFAEYNYHVRSDPRAHVYEDDGQSFIRTVPRTYDVIISAPSNPWIAGIGGLFTVEFFAAVRDKLNPDGVFTFWFHTYEQTDETVALVFRTVAAVFPHAMVFADKDFGNAIAVASLAPLAPDFAAMEARFGAPAVRDDLARLRLPNLAALLSHHRLSSASLRAAVGEGPLNTLAHERLEYVGPRSQFHRDSSFLLEQVDPLLAGETPPTDALLDRYLADRAARGAPLPPAEIEAAAHYVESIGGYGREIGTAIRARGPTAGPNGG